MADQLVGREPRGALFWQPRRQGVPVSGMWEENHQGSCRDLGLLRGASREQVYRKEQLRAWFQNVNLKGKCFFLQPEKHNRHQG